MELSDCHACELTSPHSLWLCRGVSLPVLFPMWLALALSLHGWGDTHGAKSLFHLLTAIVYGHHRDYVTCRPSAGVSCLRSVPFQPAGQKSQQSSPATELTCYAARGCCMSFMAFSTGSPVVGHCSHY